MKIVLAHSVKHKIMSYALFERNHTAVVTEGLNAADVLSITSKMAYEFEIKVSKSDLDKEIAAIRYATMTMKEGKQLAPISDGPQQEDLNLELAGLKNKAGGWTKISKHEEYIDPKKYFELHKRYMYGYNYIPNYFYIVVPRNLVEYTKEKTEGTGYGVIAYNGCRQENQHYGRNDNDDWVGGQPCTFDRSGCIEEVAVKRKAKKIHSDPIDDSVIMSMLSRTSAENVRMIREIITLNEILESRPKQSITTPA